MTSDHQMVLVYPHHQSLQLYTKSRLPSKKEMTSLLQPLRLVLQKRELLLQRDALLNESDDKQVERELELDAGGKSGIIERDRYNKIPYAVG